MCQVISDSLNQYSWWRHQMQTLSALLAICVVYSPVTGEFPAQRPETRSFDVFFDLPKNKRLSKQYWGWWFEAPSRQLWRHCNGIAWFFLSGYIQHQGVIKETMLFARTGLE